MGRFKAIIYLFFLLFTQNIFAQVDTVTFRVMPDVGNAYKVNCLAFKVNFEPTDTLYEEFELSDTINSAYTFNWSGDVGPVSIANVHQAIYQYDAPGAYEIVLTIIEDATGETYIATDTAYIQDLIHVPNVFTPNDDNINDFFIVRANGIDPIEIFIYSKTGTLVYKDTSPVIVWDGRNSSGSLVSPGVYYYILKPSNPTHREQKGFLHLIYHPDDL